jgi:general secretion pathway protein H
MPILAIGIWNNRRRQTGFTLLEVMVTVILISIIAGFAILSLRGSDPSERLATEGRRLSALLTLTQQEALFRAEQRGIRFTETSYAFFTRSQDGKWRPSTDSALHQDYQLPPGLQLTLWVENRLVDFTKATTHLPQVLLLSNGEVTAFKLVFSFADGSAQDYQIVGDLTGHFHSGPTT